MSWKNRTDDRFTIITGNGSVYYPLWKGALKHKEFNVSRFEFIDVPGTLVSRGTPKGRVFKSEIYFQGEDHLDISEDFENSCNDPRPWRVYHPLYGDLLVQPISIEFDNTDDNITRISLELFETISDDNPKIKVNPVDRVLQHKVATIENMAVSFSSKKVTTSDVNGLVKNTDTLYKKGKKVVPNTPDFEKYFNAFNEANAFLEDAIAEPLAAIRKVQAVINAPALFAISVQERVNILISQFESLRDTIVNIVTLGDKRIYENNAGSLIASMTEAAVTEPDYRNRAEVFRVMKQITDAYDDYIEDLDSIQSDNGGSPDSFIPDASSINSLSTLISYTVSNLFNIAISIKQERSFFLEEDTNLILLAHRLYGLEPDDSTIDTLVKDNSVSLSEYLQIKKGRKITYSV